MVIITKEKFKHFLFAADYVPEIKNPELIKDASGIRLSLDKLSYLLNHKEISKRFSFTEEEIILCLQLSVMIHADALEGLIIASKIDSGKEIVIHFEGDID